MDFSIYPIIDEIREDIERLEKCLLTLTAWLAQSHVFGQQDFDAMSKLLTEKIDSTKEEGDE